MVLFTHAIHQNSMGQAVDAVELMEDLVVGTGTKKVVLPTTTARGSHVYISFLIYIYTYNTHVNNYL